MKAIAQVEAYMLQSFLKLSMQVTVYNIFIFICRVLSIIHTASIRDVIHGNGELRGSSFHPEDMERLSRSDGRSNDIKTVDFDEISSCVDDNVWRVDALLDCGWKYPPVLKKYPQLRREYHLALAHQMQGKGLHLNLLAAVFMSFVTTDFK